MSKELPSGNELPEADVTNDSDAPQPTEEWASSTVKPGQEIGRYTLREKIGEGGMGEVWDAKQAEPVKRRVALKLIKAGMDSKAVLKRFEQERQALALMDHPNIARVLDGGLTQIGQPYFVMELVSGKPLDEFCDEAKLSLEQRLELFVPVCQAVQHAHHKGIVHRDLKPSNIIVTVIDGHPVPKIIDFGLAKAFGNGLSQDTMTQFGTVVGTLEYMSPEQANYSGNDIDTRTDIYSLGVILYEVLTGLRPIDAARLKKAALTEMVRIIREEEPSKPSTRLSSDGTLPSVAALRKTEPSKLMALLRGELDWLVMKCLEKDRERRYETANALLRDIQRYLSDEPVEARPASTGYRLQKFLQRNKGPAIAASLLLVSLLVGIAGTTWGLFEAQEQTANAIKAKEEAEQISQFLTDVFKSPDPTRDGHEIRVVELLEVAAEKLEDDLAEQPARRAVYQEMLATTYSSLGLDEKALPLQELAYDYYLSTIGPKNETTLRVLNYLANYYYGSGQRDKGMEMKERVLKLRQEVLGPEHLDTLGTMNRLAYNYISTGRLEQALKYSEKVYPIRLQRLGPEDLETLSAMSVLAMVYMRVGQREKGLQLHKECVDLASKHHGQEHRSTLAWTTNLAAAYFELGHFEEALELREKVLPLKKKVLGPQHPHTFIAMRRLADSYRQAGRFDKAIELRKEVLDVNRELHGPQHRNSISALNALAWALATSPDQTGNYRKAESAVELARQACDLRPNYGSYENTLGTALYRAQQWQDAIETLNQSIEHGSDSPDNWLFLAMANWQLDRKEQAREWYRKALTWRKESPVSAELQTFFDEAAKLIPDETNFESADVPSGQKPLE